MKKTRELIAENLRLVSVVVEVCDARIPVSSRNPVLGELTGGKPRILVLNKSDLADGDATDAWIASYGRKDFAARDGVSRAIAMNSVTGDGMKKLLAALAGAAGGRKAGQSEDAADGRGRGNAEGDAGGRRNAHAGGADAPPPKAAKPLRAMVVGVPNSGKSSLINRLTGRRSAQTGDRPGITKGKQWLTLANGVRLLDTPGILWPKFEDPNVGLNLAFCGSIRDEIMDVPGLALELIKSLENLYPGALARRFGIEKDGRSARPGAEGEPGSENGSGAEAWRDAAAGSGAADERDAADELGAEDWRDEGADTDPALLLMEAIARGRGCILPGKRIDYERAGRMLLDEVRAGKLGRITLERV
jgi:ribosome biogenesis GTPase A